jgi:hypothetical protein
MRRPAAITDNASAMPQRRKFALDRISGATAFINTFWEGCLMALMRRRMEAWNMTMVMRLAQNMQAVAMKRNMMAMKVNMEAMLKVLSALWRKQVCQIKMHIYMVAVKLPMNPERLRASGKFLATILENS